MPRTAFAPLLALSHAASAGDGARLSELIGPLLDHLRHGRRYALATAMLGRAMLAWLIADHLDNVALYPAAFGVLVLSRGYGVGRAAAGPPPLGVPLLIMSAAVLVPLISLFAMAWQGSRPQPPVPAPAATVLPAWRAQATAATVETASRASLTAALERRDLLADAEPQDSDGARLRAA